MKENGSSDLKTMGWKVRGMTRGPCSTATVPFHCTSIGRHLLDDRMSNDDERKELTKAINRRASMGTISQK